MPGLDPKLIDEILSRGQLYEVGGCVRDSLMGVGTAEKDRDYIVTRIPFEDLVRLLKRFGQVDLVGRSFGVIKFTPPPHGAGEAAVLDIALPRKERSTGVKHRDFSVEFDHELPLEHDLERRDFTINAIARNLRSGQLVDPFGGQVDLKRGLIRMLRPDTFGEDPLRMLRAVQFAARFEFEIEPQTFAAIRENAALIETVSLERIQEELNKLLLKARLPSIGFFLLRDSGLLELILPELATGVAVDQPGGYHAYDVFTHSAYTVDQLPPRLRLRLAGLFHDVAKPQTKAVAEGHATFYGHEKVGARAAERALERLRYSNQTVKEVVLLVDKHMFTTQLTDKGVRRLIRKVGEDLIFDLLDLRRGDVVAQGMGNATPDVDLLEGRIRAELERKVPLGLADLAIDGRDLMREFGIPESILVGQILRHLLEIVLDYPEQNQREILLEKARLFMQAKEHE